jgi:beta-lactamase regulating signal transducer with metallopeptidase domain
VNTLAEFAWIQIWQTTLVALGVGPVVRLTCRRRPHLAYLLWMVVILKCLTPPIWSSPTGIFSWTMSRSPATGSPGASAAIQGAKTQPSLQTTSSTSLRPSAQEGTSASAKGFALSYPRWTITHVVLVIWLAGAMASAEFLLFSIARISARLRRSALPLDPAWLRELDECARRLNVRRPVRLLVTSQQVGPAVYGYLCPVVVLPEVLVTRQPPIAWDSILSHELIHIRRRDPLVALVQAVARCLWWFHPLVWWASREADRERERACDEAVLADLALDPAEYAQSLLDVVKLKQQLRPMLAFPGVRAVEVTTRRLEHIMRPEFQFRSRTSQRHWAIALAAAMLVLPGARLAFDSLTQASEPDKSAANSIPAADVQDMEKEPNFVVIPVRTELQRKLLSVDESVVAVIELNGYGLVGKRDGELLQAIDEAALQKSLSALRRRGPKSSVGIRLLYDSGSVAPEIREAAPNDLKPIEEACRAMASKVNLGIRPPTNQYFNVGEHVWQRLLAASSGLDLTREMVDESAEGDDQVIVYPVRTKTTRLLTGGFLSSAPDCVVYVLKPLDADNNPLMDLELCKRIKDAVWKLELANKNRIDFHVVPAGKDPESWQRSRHAIFNRMVGDDSEAQWLARSLGFKTSSVTY